MPSAARAKVISAAQKIALLTCNNCMNNYSTKPFSRKWGHMLSVAEPTSVLDICSSSPSSTPSSCLAGTCEGPLGSAECNTVGLSGLGKSFEVSQVIDCITSSKQDAAPVRSSINVHGLSEENLAGEIGGIPTGIKVEAPVWDRVELAEVDAVANVRNFGNCLVSEANWHVSGVSHTHQEGTRFREMENAYQAGRFLFSTTDVISDTQGEMMNMEETVEQVALVEGRLEACVMQCLKSRKRRQGDLLGEVVQKVSDDESKKWREDWLASEWNELWPTTVGVTNSGGSLAHQQQASPAQMPCSSAIAGGTFVSNCNGGNSVLTAPQKLQQLDLYEALQASLLYSGSSTNGLLNSQSHQRPLIPSLSGCVSSSSAHLNHGPTLAPCASQPSTLAVFSCPPCQSPPLHFVPRTHSALSVPLAPGSSSEFLTVPQSFAISYINCSTRPSSGIHQVPSASKLETLQGCPMDAEWMLVNDGFPNWQTREGVHQAECNNDLAEDEGTERASALVPLALLQALSEHQLTSMPHMVGSWIPFKDLLLAQRTLSAAMDALDQGNRALAQAILARLNNLSSAEGQPMHRAIFYFKEALTQWVALGSSGCSFSTQHKNHLLCPLMGCTEPDDIISKIDAYKNFCEISVIPQFAHFTTNQVILEAMDDEQCIHIIDFELGLGGQWASFMQEISQRSTGPPDFLKITTIGVPDSLEMQLAKENLVSFASELGLTLHFDVLPVPGLGCLKAFMVPRGERDAVAINFGFGMCHLLSDFASMDALVSFLQFIKSLSPKVVTVMDSEFGHVGSPNQMDSLRFYSCIFESLECLGLAKEIVLQIEGLLFAPKIAALVQGRIFLNSIDNLPPWRALLRSAGFTVMNPSSVAEMQVRCLIRSPAHKGFSVKKQEGYLYLFWIDQPLLAASSWVC